MVLNISPGSDKPVLSGSAVYRSEKLLALADVKDVNFLETFHKEVTSAFLLKKVGRNSTLFLIPVCLGTEWGGPSSCLIYLFSEFYFQTKVYETSPRNV